MHLACRSNRGAGTQRYRTIGTAALRGRASQAADACPRTRLHTLRLGQRRAPQCSACSDATVFAAAR
jgi:hypothetical protein